MIRVERIVNRLFASNTFAISESGSKDVWLVDVGDTERVLDILPLKSNVRGVFLTHTHFDHLYGINQLYDAFPEMIVLVAEEGIANLYSSKKNLSKYHESPLEYKGAKVIGLHDRDRFELYSNAVLETIATPGHTPDSMAFLLEGKYLFTGDAYIPNVKVVSKLPGGNKKQALKSRDKLIQIGQGKILCPGHGDIENKQ